jgi:hypothetical protein
VHGELGNIWKEAVVACLEVYRDLSGGIDENHEKRQLPGIPVEI